MKSEKIKTKAMALAICIVILIVMGGLITTSAAKAEGFTKIPSMAICLQSSHSGTWNYDLTSYGGKVWIGTTEGPGGAGKYYDTLGVQIGDLMILTAVRPGWDTNWWITDTVRWDFSTYTGVGSWMNDSPANGTGINWWVCTVAPDISEPYGSLEDLDKESL